MIPLRLIIVFFISFLVASKTVHAQRVITQYDQLVQVNEQWKNQADADPALRTTTAANLTAQQLIQFHLEETEKLLRKRNTDYLSANVRKSREVNLNTLHNYWQRGVFPMNDLHLNRQPYFIDKFNTYCAVGYLMQQSGADDIAKDIKRNQNYSYLADISHPSLMQWVAASGLTFDELALIQPGYGGEWPATITEFHYNNVGKDVNEYIEVHQSNGGLIGMATLKNILFYNHIGALYKTLPIGEMQGFYRNNTENRDSFYYYTFPANENFADSGKIELRSGPDTTNILAVYTYNSSGVTHDDRYVYWRTAPGFFPITENESSPAGSSLTFCGLYNTTWNLSSQTATPGMLNTCTKGAFPITLSLFNYTVINRSVELKWETASEANNSYFEIQRSNNGISFDSVGRIQGSGNSNSLKKYLFTDNTPNYINHYRLKQVDLDGKSAYSQILYVKVAKSNPLIIAQDMVKNNLQLQINAEQNNINELIISDFLGREVLHTKGKSGSQNINVSRLGSGKYLVRLYTKDGQVYNQQFVIQ